MYIYNKYISILYILCLCLPATAILRGTMDDSRGCRPPSLCRFLLFLIYLYFLGHICIYIYVRTCEWRCLLVSCSVSVSFIPSLLVAIAKFNAAENKYNGYTVTEKKKK